jgi:hypothetical protein
MSYPSRYATSAKARFIEDPLHGPKGPFFHRFFALKREEKRWFFRFAQTVACSDAWPRKPEPPERLRRSRKAQCRMRR